MPIPIPPAEATPGLRSEAFKTPKPVDPPDEVDGRYCKLYIAKSLRQVGAGCIEGDTGLVL